MKTTLITAPDCDLHQTGDHIEAVARRLAVIDHLTAGGLLVDRPLLTPAPAGDADLALVHDPAYIDLIGRAARAGGGWLDHDTIVTAGSDEAARAAAGGAILAMERALTADHRAFAVVRPPGHHALAATGMGFCLYNGIAVAAAVALDRYGLDRVLIVDWDVHHGNGTQAIFAADPRVCFFSVHQWPHYPGSGLVDEIGTGAGRGATINVPVPAGTGDAGYVRIFSEVLIPAARRFRPQLILVSAGYDAHQNDPLGGIRLTTAGFGRLTNLVVALAEELCGGRVAFVLEGGYNLPALAESVALTLRESDRDQLSLAPAVASSADSRLVDRVIHQARHVHGL